MIWVTIFDTATGLIKRRTQCPEEMAEIQAGDGESCSLLPSEGFSHIIGGSPITPIIRPSLEEARELKKQELAKLRYAAETAGFDLGGAHIDSDREAQAQLAGALLSFRSGFIVSTDWKTSGVWVPVELAQVEALSAAMAQHVQACFGRERDLCAAVDAALTVDDVEAITW